MTIEVLLDIILYVFVFLFGIVIGSFLNVCILRIPAGESIVTDRSHCMSCGYQLEWYDLLPLFSYLFLGGRCRKCKAHISVQYPVVEAANGVLWILVFMVNGFNYDSALYCLMTSALLVLSVIDFRTQEIPFGINIFILTLGLIHLVLHLNDWALYVIGLLSVSAVLELLVLASKGRAMGGGDVKLMAAAGFLDGWKNIVLALILGCILGSVIHSIRMKLSGEDHVLAMGPYLSAGIFIAALWGDVFVHWYLGMFTPM
ncbi:MAG: prepilin peptidase [Lachnospiraceae bacterium]|nr:prepilin peptidase [Lachnospiraceae bacterium]